jgi:hypothetical protein
VFKELRVKIFNWFAAGRLTLTYEKPQEYNMSQSTYTLGGTSPGTINITPGFGGAGSSAPHTSQTMTIKITPANGGTIVQMQTGDYTSGELHIIPEGADFDRELGKIITMSKLKS